MSAPTDPRAPQPPPDAAARARRGTAERWAIGAITVEFMALVRSLAEVYRLRAVAPPPLTLADALPYVAGGLVAALFCWASVTLFFLRRYRAAAWLAAAMVVVLLVYKLEVMG